MQTNYDHITDEFNFQKETLERQISVIEVRQQEIQMKISEIENANNHLDILIQTEKDPKRKNSYYSAKVRNIELMTKLYDCYRSFEDVKFKYYNNISDIIHKSHRLIEVEIRKIDEKLAKLDDDGLVDVLKNVSQLFIQSNNSGNSVPLPTEVQSEIEQINQGEFKL